MDPALRYPHGGQRVVAEIVERAAIALREQPQRRRVFPSICAFVSVRPDLELDEGNIVTLCGESDELRAGNHHLLLGHFDDYESMNLRVRHEAEHDFHGWTALHIRASSVWRLLVTRREPSLGDLMPVRNAPTPATSGR